jgi:ketosteroid isomerase-like protein
LIETVYAAFGRGDIAAIMDSLSDDVVFIAEGPALVPFTGVRKGKAAVLGFFEALGTTQTNQQLTTEGIAAQGDSVTTWGRYSGVVTATGKSFDSGVAHVFTIRNGKIVQFQDYMDTAAMVDAYTAAAAAAR